MSIEKLALVKLVLCGPNDVAKEIDIAKDVVQKWNQLHGEARGLAVKHHYWLTDTYPDLGKRAQDIPNRQLIDKSKILVAIFWARFGTPTGVADSGTQEEILRAADAGRKVMVYFSDLEPKPADADARQLEKLWQFRQSLRARGICSNFNSRDEFRKLFTDHLALAMNAFDPQTRPQKPARKKRSNVSQNAKTNRGNIYQNVGDTYNYTKPPTKKVVRERRPESVTTEEVFQINEWITVLAENEVDKTRREAFAMWGGRFKKHFQLGHREDLPSAKMPDAEAWYKQQLAIQKSELESKAPDQWRSARNASIKAAMREMGLTNNTYYPDLSQRLKIKPFDSLTTVTKKNLKRIYSMVRGDVQKFRRSKK